MSIPFAPGAARAYLISRPEMTALIPAGSITTRDVPQKITGPFITLRATGNVGPDPMMNKPIVQVDTWVPKAAILGGTTDPDEVAWNVSVKARDLLSRARNVRFRDAAWSGRWIDGPITFPPDVTRGVDFPLFRATCRVELKMRALSA
ncbi:hypothetical protein [Rhodococcus aetherivorans]|uniref:hypothetical protein n=1 Tax=Rhodococcus aetherivorans TaxID=191292 RepID=UPI0002D21668|nr:hypothetical protein [Rhodococcus aetherivorans]CCW14604.1 hypothetical protein EBESD8_51740 [Rhodococcus aetherivorans]